MATTKITNPELFDLGSLNTALQLPSGTTAERPTSPSTGEWRYNTDNNLIEFYDGADWRNLQDEEIPPLPSEHFSIVLYTGTGSAQSITGVGFQPDWVWIKERSQAESHRLFDSTRGATQRLFSNSTSAQSTASDSLTSFDSDGFSLGVSAGVNENSQTYVAWCWKANGGTTSSNTDGSITSTVQANTKAGFSIVQWTGTGSAGTLGHGLSSAPELIMVKDTTVAYNWYVYTTATGSNIGFEGLNTDAASFAASSQMTSTSTLITNVPSIASLNTSGSAMIIYAFHSVAGYSKIGSYTGNGSDNGPIVNTGFQVRYIMLKCTSGTHSWLIYDASRPGTSITGDLLYADTDQAENPLPPRVSFLSNGFQIVTNNTSHNASGLTYIYMAFASDPSAAPVLADSFNTSLYTGNGTSQSITGVGFQPNLVWIKARNITYDHALTDSTRGVTHPIYITTGAQLTNSTFITSFDSNGFSIGNNAVVNNNTNTYVAWNWKANSIPTINTDGTTQSIVSVNQAAGMSIVEWPQTAATSTNVGHGLNSAPDLIITKAINDIDNWYVYNSASGVGKFLYLNLSNAEVTSATAYSAVDATTFTANLSNNSGINMISYCFHSVSGFSSIGSYAGDSTSGRLINTGFETNWVMIKTTNATSNWFVIDSARGGLNDLRPNSNSAEQTRAAGLTFVSNGFEIDDTTLGFNSTGTNYIYIAFKENPTPYPLAGNMSFLVVAGGASGGRQNAGGGGAGGLRTSYGGSSGGGSSAESDITLAAGTYTITVGAGGAALTTNGVGNNGVDSSIAASGLTTITSIGGGGGYGFTYSSNNANSGGSGGGAGTTGSNSASGFGSGTANQGFDGGARFATVNTYAGGGGGGASQAGQASTGQEDGGDGGNGLSVSITGSAVTYAGGGGGGGNTTVGAGGSGGGTAGGLGSGSVADASANTGGGSGGTRDNVTAGSGGSGVVILRLATSEYSGTTTGSPTVTTDGDYTVLTYTGSGTYVHS